MEFRILGPVELRIDGHRHDLGSPKLRSLFACLALEPNRAVPIDTLADRLWGEKATDNARDTLYTYKNRLHKRIFALTDGQVRIGTRDHGYVLEIDEELIDLHRFLRIRDQGVSLANSGLLEQSAALLREAKNVWRGEPIADLDGLWAEQIREALNDQWLETTRTRIRIELVLGRFGEVSSELRRLVAEHPYDELLVEYLMRALHSCGRNAEALSVYEAHRRRMNADLEAEPRPELDALHGQLLTGTVEPLAPPAGTGRAHPNNLKRDVPEFTGRTAEITRIIESLPSPGSGIAVPVQAVHGMPGVGKTAFAIHLAYRLADRYPDAQLFVDLHGHDHTHGVTDPSAALERLLQILGVPPGQIPVQQDSRAELWRSRMADQRAIVVLDNAASGEQVRDLFPGAPDCLVIVTSRVRLSGLPGVRSRGLGTLPADDGSRLFASIVDDASRIADDASIDDVIRLCEGLPLAIRLVAARFKERTSWTARDLVRRLVAEGQRLGELRAGGEAVRSAFESSYQSLGDDHRRAFRTLSLHLGDDFTVHAAAALLDLSPADTDRTIEALLECHLLEEAGSDRFRFHDLLREYARDRVAREEPEPDRQAAERRLLQYYVDLAACADGVLQPYLPPAEPRTPPYRLPRMTGFAGARERLETELSGLLNAARNHYQAVPRLAHHLAYFLDLVNHWNTADEIHTRAVRAWRTNGDRHGELVSLLDLVLIRMRLSQYDQALRLAGEVLDVARARGDQGCEAAAQDRFGLVHLYLGRCDDALGAFAEASRVYERLGDQKGIAEILAHSGRALLELREYDAALARFRRAYAVYRRIGDDRGTGHALIAIGEVYRIQRRAEDALASYERASPLVEQTMGPLENAIHRSNLAHIWRQQGRYAEALEAYRETLAAYQRLGDRPGEAESMNDIGTTLTGLGRSTEALIHFQGAVAVARDIGDHAEELRGLQGIGAARLNSGQLEKALEHYEEAHRVAGELGRPYERGAACLALGRALRRLRGEAAARPYLTEAAALLDAVGAEEADEAHALLRDPGATGT